MYQQQILRTVIDCTTKQQHFSLFQHKINFNWTIVVGSLFWITTRTRVAHYLFVSFGGKCCLPRCPLILPVLEGIPAGGGNCNVRDWCVTASRRRSIAVQVVEVAMPMVESWVFGGWKLKVEKATMVFCWWFRVLIKIVLLCSFVIQMYFITHCAIYNLWLFKVIWICK